MDTALLTQVSQFGFPIVISLFLLTRLEKKMELLSIALNELNTSIILLSKQNE